MAGNKNPLLDSAEYADLFANHAALDGATRRARGALQRIARDVPDLVHAAEHDGPVIDLLGQLEYRLQKVLDALDEALPNNETAV